MRQSIKIDSDGTIKIPKYLVEEVFGKAHDAVLHIRSGCMVLSPVYVDIDTGKIPEILERYFQFQSIGMLLRDQFSTGKIKEGTQFEGDLSIIALSDVLMFLSASKKSGCLLVEGEITWGIFLENGNIVYSSSDQRRFSLAAYLLKKHFITEQDLVTGLSRIKNDAEVLNVLENLCAIPSETFHEQHIKSIEDLLFSLLITEKGHFRFLSGNLKIQFILELPMTTTNYVMESTRRMDEMARIKDKLPPSDAILEIVDDITASMKISYEEEQILTVTNGIRNFQEVLIKSKVGDVEGKKAVASLLTAGLIRARAIQKEEKVKPADTSILPKEEMAVYLEKIDAYNNVFSTIQQALLVEVGNKTEVILGAFFKGLEPGKSLLSGFLLDQSGMLNTDDILKSLSKLPKDTRMPTLIADLNELLYFELFAVKNALGPEMEHGIVEMAKSLLQ